MEGAQTAIVTGATQGIGKAIALALLAEGRQVVAIGRSAEKLNALQCEAGEAARLTVETLERPVKTYSSGMFMRLAFAAATQDDGMQLWLSDGTAGGTTPVSSFGTAGAGAGSVPGASGGGPASLSAAVE